MPVLETRSDLPTAHRVLYVLFAITFLLLPFYYQDNLGGEGMSLPFNSTIWIGVVGIIGAGILHLLRSGVWVKPSNLGLLLLFPLGILASGFISGMDRPGEWVIRLGVVLGGILFWFSLSQFNLKRRDFENLLYLLLASMLIHAMVGLMQSFPDRAMQGWIPVSPDARLLGMFQQPNLQASMMATAAVLALYLASVPGFVQQRWPMKSLIVLTLFLSVFETVGTGSRTGLLGLVLGLGLIALARLKIWRRRPVWAMVFLALIVGGSYTGLQLSGGELRAYSKLERLADEGKDARPHIYRIAVDTFERSPIVGHGIGSFQSEFQDQRAIYYDPVVGETIDSARFSHPHNELLFWMIEGGTVALLAILAAAIAVFAQLAKLGWERGAAVAALLLPIVIHTQTELPFYISTLHWLVLLVLLALCFYPRSAIKQVRLSKSASGLLTGTSIVLVPLLTIFLVNSLLAQTGIMRYLKSKGTEPTHLGFALSNLYFRETGEYFLMRAMLYSNLEDGNQKTYEDFINWAEGFLTQIPDIQIYQDLAIAYRQSGDQDAALKTLDKAQATYPTQPRFALLKEKIERGEMLVTANEAKRARELAVSDAQ